MTTIRYNFRQIFIMVLLTVFSSSYAADKSQKVITVTIPKFGSGLVETWIKKYTEAHPDVQIRLVAGSDEEADLRFVSEIADEEDKVDSHVTYVGRYALLPVTTVQNPLYEQITRRRFDEKALKKLFFQHNALQEVENGKKRDELREGVTVYSGTNRVSGANAFAAYFGYQTAQLRGKRIAGDDIYLLTAISKDHTGVTFNNLTYLFDLESRKLKPQLSLLPLDVKKEQGEILRNGDLDETLQLLENDAITLVPLREVGFAYKDKHIVAGFLHWIVSEGQQYNHDFGFLTLDKKQAQKEKKQLETKLLTSR